MELTLTSARNMPDDFIYITRFKFQKLYEVDFPWR